MSDKKKKWFKSAFDEELPTPKGLRTLSENDSIDLTLLPDDTIETPKDTSKSAYRSIVPLIEPDFKSSNWIENFAPRSKEDLAIHAKKIVELENWFRFAETNRKKCLGPILLITGPSGCGKTSTLKVIAKEFGYSISEWVTPVDVEYVRHNAYNQDDSVMFKENQNDTFSQFLFQSSRYRSVFECNESKRLVLVEDLPNGFIRDPALFGEVLARYTSYGKSPLVFIVTDTKSKTLNIAYNLFGDAERQKYSISNISFNAVSETLLKKGLKRIGEIMSQPGFSKYYTEPNKSVIESIVISSQGDIRNAVINLHFASQKNATQLEIRKLPLTLAPAANAAKRSKAAKKNKLKSLGCDETITVMHALGRIFNPKYNDLANPDEMKSFLHSPEDIANVFSTQPRNMLTLTHTNYLCHFNTIEHALGATDILTRADIFINDWREDLSAELGLNLAVRGLMVYNEKPVTGWMPIRSSKSYKTKIYNQEDEMKPFGIKALISANIWATDYRFFANIIRSKSSK